MEGIKLKLKEVAIATAMKMYHLFREKTEAGQHNYQVRNTHSSLLGHFDVGLYICLSKYYQIDYIYIYIYIYKNGNEG